jgi:hypothetical protein
MRAGWGALGGGLSARQIREETPEPVGAESALIGPHQVLVLVDPKNQAPPHDSGVLAPQTIGAEKNYDPRELEVGCTVWALQHFRSHRWMRWRLPLARAMTTGHGEMAFPTRLPNFWVSDIQPTVFLLLWSYFPAVQVYTFTS